MSISRLNWFILFALAQPAWTAERRSITEEEALELLTGTPATLSLALEEERALAEASREGLWPNPGLFFSREDAAGVTDEFFTVEQILPVTGRLGLERSAADTAARATRERLEHRRLALRAEVRIAFHRLLAAQQRSRALEEGRDHVAELVRILRFREQAGESSGFDRMRSERELAEVEVDLIEARREEDGARSALAGLLALEVGVELVAEGRLEGIDEVPPLEGLLARAETRGDVAAFELERQSAEIRSRAASRRWIPEPALAVGTKKTETPGLSDRGSVLSFTIPVPVFNHGQRDAALAQAEQSLSGSRYETRLRAARAEIELAYLEVLRRREAEKLYRGGARPEELVRVARIAYDEGEQGILELLDAYRTALAVELRKLQLAAASHRARIRLDLVVGEELTP